MHLLLNAKTFTELLKITSNIYDDLNDTLNESEFWKYYDEFLSIYHNYYEHYSDIISRTDEVKKYLNI